ncbi:hypothetical protein CCP4SC76_6420002 [Gammaproteobacteria bacterium]
MSEITLIDLDTPVTHIHAKARRLEQGATSSLDGLRNGITLARVQQIAEVALHPNALSTRYGSRAPRPSTTHARPCTRTHGDPLRRDLRSSASFRRNWRAIGRCDAANQRR